MSSTTLTPKKFTAITSLVVVCVLLMIIGPLRFLLFKSTSSEIAQNSISHVRDIVHGDEPSSGIINPIQSIKTDIIAPASQMSSTEKDGGSSQDEEDNEIVPNPKCPKLKSYNRRKISSTVGRSSKKLIPKIRSNFIAKKHNTKVPESTCDFNEECMKVEPRARNASTMNIQERNQQESESNARNSQVAVYSNATNCKPKERSVAQKIATTSLYTVHAVNSILGDSPPEQMVKKVTTGLIDGMDLVVESVENRTVKAFKAFFD